MAGVPLGDTPESHRTGSAGSVTTISSYSLIEWMHIQLLDEFSATWFSNNTNLLHNISVQQQGKEAKHNTTTAPTRHPLPSRRRNTTHTYRTTHPPTDQATHPPTIPPTMLQQYDNKRMRCLYSNFARARRLYSGENKILLLHQTQ